ncbi:MAG: MFS transporter [Rikenellaceae bacterium]|jgi:MFS family permease|nr:MFS transporter [Rikenellaceae bacterium]
MVKQIQDKLKTSSKLRWVVLCFVSFTMLTGYLISDIMAPLETLCEQQLGWNADNNAYRIYTSAYGWFNVFLLMLIFGGMILDRMGARFTGILAVVLMICGTGMQYYAMSHDFGEQMVTISIFGWQILNWTANLFWAALGFAIFGVGIEMIGITANKIVVQWFTGHSLAMAIGLNTAAGRVGTALALFGSGPFAAWRGSVSAPMGLGLMMLFIGLVTFIIYIMIDRKAHGAKVARSADPEDQFKFRDIARIMSIRGFWYIAILCVLFYSAVFPFLKYAVNLMVQKFHLSAEWAGMIPALMPMGNILMTPLFGSIYDKKGRGATIMIIGAVLLLAVHLLFSLPGLDQLWQAVALVICLGVAFSLVPSAMWPSVPKIVPYKMLGTAYALIFWIQNWGLMGVPLLIGWIRNKYCVTGTIEVDGQMVTAYDYTLPMLTFAMFGVASVVVALLLRREDRIKGFGLELPNNK